MSETNTLKKKISIKQIIILQIAVCIYTLSGIAAKFASNYNLTDFLTLLKNILSGTADKTMFNMVSLGFVLCYGIELVILGVYAIIWQQIIKKVDISTAYANRAIAIFWSTLWAITIFKEHISIQNIIGICIIVLGTWMVNRDDK